MSGKSSDKINEVVRKLEREERMSCRRDYIHFDSFICLCNITTFLYKYTEIKLKRVAVAFLC